MSDTQEQIERCPICKQEMEDARHVGVECGYEVQEFVPEAEKSVFFCEVSPEASIWGVTRQYSQGTRDTFTILDKGMTAGGIPHREIIRNQKPLDAPIRLVEVYNYSLRCCKTCRAEFLGLLKRWNSGEFITYPREGE